MERVTEYFVEWERRKGNLLVKVEFEQNPESAGRSRLDKQRT